jgi:pyridoxal phosphate enzyme (YggS family)
MIPENIENTKKRIQEVCFRCGRNPADVVLVAVSKTFAVEKIQAAVNAGLLDFGENYVQELNEKRGVIGTAPLRWHFIGHLQTNKVKYIADFIHLIHSVDNERLAAEIQKRGEQAGRRISVLVEVHTTDEVTKYGVRPEQAVDLVRKISRYDKVNVEGLMTMGPFSEDPNDSRPSFRLIRELKQEIEKEEIENVSMRHLSMGMTHDFEVAIEEGSTLVRLGTVIFGERPKET